MGRVEVNLTLNANVAARTLASIYPALHAGTIRYAFPLRAPPQKQTAKMSERGYLPHRDTNVPASRNVTLQGQKRLILGEYFISPPTCEPNSG